MSSDFIEMMNGISFGQVLILLAGFGAIVIGIKKYLSQRDDKIRAEFEKEDTQKDESAGMLASIEELSKDLKRLSGQVTDITTQIENNKNETAKKIDELSKAITEEKSKRKSESSEICKELQHNRKTLERVTQRVNILLDSDKEDIKGYIVKEYQKWMPLKIIDFYSMDTLEKKYEKYLQEDGDSFVEGLMIDLRSLKKVNYMEYLESNQALNGKNRPIKRAPIMK